MNESARTRAAGHKTAARGRKPIPRIRAGVIALLVSICKASASGEANICEREMIRAANENSVPVAVLYAVALTETGQRGLLHAYAMNIEGRPSFNSTLEEALKRFAAARENGARLIDIGCMQVNHHYHGKRFRSVEEMFEPRLNVDYAARFLRDLRGTEGSWTAAVARYHAGPKNAPAQRSYVCAVIGNMVASGFGAWTGESAAFCRK